MNLFSRQNVFFPPVGIAHITTHIGQIAEPYLLPSHHTIHINSSGQPNSHPHLGTITTIMTAFAVARRLSEYFALPAALEFDQLENSPGDHQTRNGVTYQLALSDIEEPSAGCSKAEYFMSSFHHLFNRLSELSGVPHAVRKYSDFQALPEFRGAVLALIANDTARGILAPASKILRVRFPCPECRWVDKESANTKVITMGDGYARFAAYCPDHGWFEIDVDVSGGSFIDTNTPIRCVAKAAALSSSRVKGPALPVMVDGGDWGGAWAVRVYALGSSLLGIEQRDLPPRYYAPIITDWSGAKFSKSLYVRGDAYGYLPESFVNYSSFLNQYGDEGITLLWDEVSNWTEAPERLFRNYSIEYIKLVLRDLN